MVRVAVPNGGYLRGSLPGVGHVASPFPISGLTPRGKVVLGPVGIGDDDCGIVPGVSAPGYRDSRPSDSGWARR